jgi:8-oxo-dGTP diphosphatase
MVTKNHDSETKAEGKQVIVACALIYHNFGGKVKVFLPRRADTKRFMPGVYELPGGHIDFGEDLIIGLRREIKEEFEKDINVENILAAFSYTNEIKGSHSVEIVYLAEFENGIENIVIHEEDHSGYRWFAENELDEMLVGGKTQDDEEYIIIKQAFDIMRHKFTNL